MFILCFIPTFVIPTFVIPTFVVVAKVVFFLDIPTNRYYI